MTHSILPTDGLQAKPRRLDANAAGVGTVSACEPEVLVGALFNNNIVRSIPSADIRIQLLAVRTSNNEVEPVRGFGTLSLIHI